MGRVVLTHDKATLIGTAWERVRTGLPMPGVVHVPWGAALGPAVEEVLCIVECGYPDEVDGQVLYGTTA